MRPPAWEDGTAESHSQSPSDRSAHNALQESMVEQMAGPSSQPSNAASGPNPGTSPMGANEIQAQSSSGLTTQQYQHQPPVASPLRSSLPSQQGGTGSEEVTPTASPEDSATNLLSNSWRQGGSQFASLAGREGVSSSRQSPLHATHQYASPPVYSNISTSQYAQYPAWQTNAYEPANIDTRRESLPPAFSHDESAEARLPAGETTASSRWLSGPSGTAQQRNIMVPGNDSDHRLEAAGYLTRLPSTTSTAGGYASSVDADYFSAPPSRLVSRTPTPVTGFPGTGRASSPDYVASAESEGEDSDCRASGPSGWGATLFGFRKDRENNATGRYRLANPGWKKGYQALGHRNGAPSLDDWKSADPSMKRSFTGKDRSKNYDARYAADLSGASYTSEGRRYPRRRNHRSQSFLPTPLRVLSSLLAKMFRTFFGPIHPLTILLALALVAGFVTSVTLLIMYILNPDKEPLPWRTYCMQQLPFPHEFADALAPVNIVVGVMTVDSKYERRNIIRNTYARHTLPTDANGNPTANVQVKFILGKVRKSHASRIALEMEAFNDIVVLDMDETQSARKTHGFFKWAAENATVPFLRPIAPAKGYNGSVQDTYVPSASAPGGLANWEYASDEHSSAPFSPSAEVSDSTDERTRYQTAWKKVDYVVKADDDTFIVLDELERHLRVAPRELTYWGYLIKNWFMGGEAYALSYDMVDWMAHSPDVSRTAKGKEDTRTPQWIALHPNRSSVNWVSEHCWIYDHPKGNSPYSHGFLFPDYVEKIKLEGRHGLSEQEIAYRGGERASQWYSTVTKWHQRYGVPRKGMTAEEQVEALIEGGGRWEGTWVRGPDGSTSERWVPYQDIVYEANDARLRPSTTDSEGRAVLAADVGLEPYSGLPILGSIDHGHTSTNASSDQPGRPIHNDVSSTVIPDRIATDKANPLPASTKSQPRKRSLLDDLVSIPRKILGEEEELSDQGQPIDGVHGALGSNAGAAQHRHAPEARYIPHPTHKDGHGEWASLRARRYLNRPHGGTVIVHYCKKTEQWLETALALCGRSKLWRNGAGGRGKEWRMGGSPLVRHDGYVFEGRSAPRRAWLAPDIAPPDEGAVPGSSTAGHSSSKGVESGAAQRST